MRQTSLQNCLGPELIIKIAEKKKITLRCVYINCCLSAYLQCFCVHVFILFSNSKKSDGQVNKSYHSFTRFRATLHYEISPPCRLAPFNANSVQMKSFLHFTQMSCLLPRKVTQQREKQFSPLVSFS